MCDDVMRPDLGNVVVAAVWGGTRDQRTSMNIGKSGS